MSDTRKHTKCPAAEAQSQVSPAPDSGATSQQGETHISDRQPVKEKPPTVTDREWQDILQICRKRKLQHERKAGEGKRSGSTRTSGGTSSSSTHRVQRRMVNKQSRQQGIWKIRSVCKKGIKKQYRHLKQIGSATAAQESELNAIKVLNNLTSDQKLKVLTVNGRGLKGKIALLRKVLEEKPDIIVWTEHHLPAGATVPRWVTIMLQGYTWRHTSLSGIKGQAGVLMAVHMDVLARTTVRIPEIAAEHQGFLCQMELQRHNSAPLMVTGVYMPTGNGAKQTRALLYQKIQQSISEAPLHMHIVAGDMNAALYKSDREKGKSGQHDKAYQNGRTGATRSGGAKQWQSQDLP